MLHVLHFTTSFSESYNVDTLFLFLQHPGETMQTLKSATQLSTATQASATAGARSDVTGADGGSLNLQHGFAITPGMFDAYVERDAQLGSDASNFAREQFEAQRLVQKKVHEHLTPRPYAGSERHEHHKSHRSRSEFVHDWRAVCRTFRKSRLENFVSRPNI